MKNILDALNWRYATKKFDNTKKINDTELEILLEALRLSPSSYGLQPWKFIVANNKDIRLKIRDIAYHQSQTTDASNLIIFTIKKNIDTNLVDEYLKFISKERGIEQDKLQGLGDMIKGTFINKSNDDLKNWASKQLYLALGVFLTSCAVSGIDACPMEGFDSVKLDELLGLSEQGLESKIIVAIGYRAEDDTSMKYKKIRYGKDEIIIKLD